MKLQPKHKNLLLAAAAALLLLNLILPVRIPWLKILITLGVAWAAWNWADPGKNCGHTAFFSNDTFRLTRRVNEQREENGVRVCRYVFSSAILDLTDSAALPERIEIQSAFSSVSVRMPVDVSITLHSSSAFSSVSIPGQKNIVFGETTCQCGTQDSNAPRIRLDANCAFSSISFTMG